MGPGTAQIKEWSPKHVEYKLLLNTKFIFYLNVDVVLTSKILHQYVFGLHAIFTEVGVHC